MKIVKEFESKDKDKKVFNRELLECGHMNNLGLKVDPPRESGVCPKGCK